MSAGIPFPSYQIFPLARTRTACIGIFSLGNAARTTDPIGSFSLTLTNVVIGSRIHVEKQSDGASLYDDLASTSTVELPLSVYSSGSPYNDLRIKVRKASSGTTYQPWETLATAVVGSNSIYVSQIPDE